MIRRVLHSTRRITDPSGRFNRSEAPKGLNSFDQCFNRNRTHPNHFYKMHRFRSSKCVAPSNISLPLASDSRHRGQAHSGGFLLARTRPCTRPRIMRPRAAATGARPRATVKTAIAEGPGRARLWGHARGGVSDVTGLSGPTFFSHSVWSAIPNLSAVLVSILR